MSEHDWSMNEETGEFPRVLTMSQRDFDRFVAALDADEEPSDKLKELFKDKGEER